MMVESSFESRKQCLTCVNFLDSGRNILDGKPSRALVLGRALAFLLERLFGARVYRGSCAGAYQVLATGKMRFDSVIVVERMVNAPLPIIHTIKSAPSRHCTNIFFSIMLSNKSQKAVERSDNDLVTPLLDRTSSDLPDEDEENPCDAEDDDNDGELGSNKAVWLYCGKPWDQFLQCVVSILLPTLLTIQFRLALAADYVSHYPILFLYIQIFFFGMAGWLYRTSLEGNEHIVIQLWPEISTDILLLLILYRQTATAIFLLDVTSLALAVHAAWNYWEQLDAETTTHAKTASDMATASDDLAASKNGLPHRSQDLLEMPLAVVL
jgi:hypothetical protein